MAKPVIVSDNLLLHPSSKIISCRNGQLSFRGDILSRIIKCPRDVSQSEQTKFPVALFSFVGSPSNEKNLLLRSFVQFYDGDSDDQARGRKNKKSKDSNTRSIHSSDFQPDVNDLTDSGIYLLHNPYYLESKKHKRYVLLMLYLYRGEGGTDLDSQSLEMLLTLISLRIAEVTLENEQIRMLRQWQRVQNVSTQHCHSFLYIFPKDDVRDDSLRVFTKNEAKQRLQEKMKTSGDSSQLDNIFKTGKMGDLNIIELKRMDSMAAMSIQSFLNAMEKLRKESKLYFKFGKDGSLVRLGGLQQFMEESILTVNKLAPPSTSANPKHIIKTKILPGDAPPDTNFAKSNQTGRGQLSKSTPPLNHQINRDNDAATQIQQGNQTGPEIIPHRFHQKTSQTPSKQFQHQADSGFEQNKILASKLIPEVVIFYNDEMKRFLSEELYDPKLLNDIHKQLSHELTSQFQILFEVSDERREKLGRKLASSLDDCFPRHSQRNSENWKMKQAKISKCLQKMMSLYMERIENVLLQNPDGMAEEQLEIKRDKIVERIKKKLSTEIQKNVRVDEPMHGHLDSLQAEINEYWDCVEERNAENLARSKQQKDIGKSNALHEHISEALKEEFV